MSIRTGSIDQDFSSQLRNSPQMESSASPETVPTAPARPSAFEVPVSNTGPDEGNGGSSPPLTPTPTPSHQHHNLVSTATARLHQVTAIRPPTPAPSPQPRSRASTRESRTAPPPLWTSASDRAGLSEADAFGAAPNHLDRSVMSEGDLVEYLRAQINSLAPVSRQLLLTHLVNDSDPSSLSPLIHLITPRLKRDFLKTLPVELAFHVLSFVDDVKTLARASGVSRFWRALLEDEATWKRMCWKSGFGNAPLPPAPTPSADSLESYRFGKMRNLEFGIPEQWDQEDDMYTPAGRERRGTLDRVALSEFAARAELFDLPVAVRRSSRSARGLEGPSVSEDARDESDRAREREGSWSDAPSPPRSTAHAAHATVQPHTGLGFTGSVISSAGGIVDRRGARSVPAFLSTQQTAETAVPRRRVSALESTSQDLTRSLPPQHRQHSLPVDTSTLVSPPMFSLPGASPSPAGAAHGSPALVDTSLPSASTTALHEPPAPAPGVPTRPSVNPFSYKTHFKRAYLTESNWLRGPGRLLSTQMSADDGVVTSLGFDEEWIVVGMATSKVHIFEAGEGRYVRTLEGHELGVWCLTLVSKGGGVSQEGSREPEPEHFHENDPFGADDFPAHGRSNTAFFSSPRARFPTAQLPRRRRSFPSASTPSSPSRANPESSTSSARSGGMGLGAGGRTGDSAGQSGACSTARGWGQKGAVVVSGGCDREVRVWDVETG